MFNTEPYYVKDYSNLINEVHSISNVVIADTDTTLTIDSKGCVTEAHRVQLESLEWVKPYGMENEYTLTRIMLPITWIAEKPVKVQDKRLDKGYIILPKGTEVQVTGISYQSKSDRVVWTGICKSKEPVDYRVDNIMVHDIIELKIKAYTDKASIGGYV